MKSFAILAMLLTASVAQAQRVSKVDGNRLLTLCNARTAAPLRPGLAAAPSTRMQCEAYVSGVADAIAQQQPMAACIPKNVTTAQLVEVTLKDLRTHPENTQLPAGRLVLRALATAFPCHP